MYSIEPFYAWRKYYQSEIDVLSPFYGIHYEEFSLRHTIYNYYIHPYWDDFGSQTLYVKVLYADYTHHVIIMELLGEWNDCLYNDIMLLKRNVIDVFISNCIKYFILIGENVLNFHYSDDSYYQEWKEDIEDGWIVAIGFRPHVLMEMKKIHLDYFLFVLNEFIELEWRTFTPLMLFNYVREQLSKYLPK
ncbi:MAG: hypothetical protein N2Z72_05450 [Bacteroidales bacterium]|nr:hypothetical protein [Bacteroidales bacterium]